MTFRHALSALLASLAIASSQSAAAESAPGTADVTIGGTTITLPVLNGFAPPSATPKPMWDMLTHSLPPTNRLLAAMLPSDALQSPPPPDGDAAAGRMLGVQTFIAVEQSGVTTAQFDELKKVMREQNKQLLVNVKDLVKDATDRVSQDAAALSGDSSTKITSHDTASLGIFDEQPNSISLAAVQTVSVAMKKGAADVRQVMALTTLRLRGKALMVSIYSKYRSEADVAWVKSRIAEWVKRVNELNP
jgi:hypothetical protein